MSNETYVNHYIEILTNTLTDALLRNISMQANLKVNEGVVGEFQSQIESSQNRIIELENLTVDSNQRITAHSLFDKFDCFWSPDC